MKEYDWMGSFLFKGVQINGEEYDNTTSSGITISLCTIVKLNVHVSNQSGKSGFAWHSRLIPKLEITFVKVSVLP